MYEWYFRRHDKEADAHENAQRAIELDRLRTIEQKHAAHLDMCRSFGFTEEQAAIEWATWLRENS